MSANDPASDRDRQRDLIVVRLASIGVHVESIFDLVNSRNPYPAAIPALIDLLGEVSDCRLKEGIARALAVKEARPVAARPLLHEFMALRPSSKQEEHLKWALGFAVSRTADDSIFGEVADQLRRCENGWMRSGLVAALGAMPGHHLECVSLLSELVADPDVEVSALDVLSRLRAPEAIPVARRLETHSDSWVRGEARKALKRLGQNPS